LRIWAVADRKSASSSISVSSELGWVECVLGRAADGSCNFGLELLGAWLAAALWAASSLLKTMALKVPVAAVHPGFGGGSTKT
jgi:hypothetical protein